MAPRRAGESGGGEGGGQEQDGIVPEAASGGSARLEHLSELAEGRYEALIEHAPDAIVVLDLDAGRFITVNAAAERLFGLPRERLVQLGPMEVSPSLQPDGRPSGELAMGYIALALQGETPRFDWVHLDAAGDPIPCEISLLRLPDPTRTLVRGSIIDVRARQRAEEAARMLQVERDAALEQLSSILASAGDGVYGIDRNDRVTFANPAASRMLGWSVDEMVGGFAHERWHHSRPGGEIYPQSECPICAAAREGRTRTVTGEVFWRRDGGSFPVEYTCAPLLRAAQIVGTVCVFRDASERLQAEIAHRTAAAQEAARLTAERLQAATAALSATMSAAEVAEVGAAQATSLLGADRVEVREVGDGRLLLPGDDGSRADPAETSPDADAARSGEVVWLRSPEDWRERYPAAAERREARLLGPTVAWPLAIGGRVLGVMTLGFARPEALDAIDLGALGTLAQQCAQALERARLYEAERRAGERQAFLAEASQLFSGTLEEQVVFDELARLCVPRIADWCVVNAVGDVGAIATLAVAHTDPALVSWAREAARRYPPDPNGRSGVGEALRSGRSELVEEITDDMVAAAARDEGHLALLRTLTLRSAMTVPVGSGGRTLAAITLLMGESGRSYDDEDLRFAEDLARRAGLAVDNARLYAEERRERERASFLAEASGALDASLGVADRLERLVRLIVPRLADLCTVRLADPDGGLELAALRHGDPERERIARRLYSRYVGPAEAGGLARVLATARAELVSEVTDEMLEAYSPDPEFLQDLRSLEPRSVIVVPLIARGGAIGAMSLIAAESGRRYGERDLALADELGRRAGLAIDNARLLEEERDARAEAEAARERVARLQRLGAALGSALGRDDVARVIVAEGMAALGAAAGAVAMRAGEDCVTLAAVGHPPDLAAGLERFPLAAPHPLAEAIRSGQPVWLETDEGWWGGLEEHAAPPLTGLALPLIVGGQAIGGIRFRFAERRRPFDETERAFTLALAGQCAQALERAERYEAEHRVALTLQRSLLPPPPPFIAGAEVALRYLPAGEGLEAGGDWYDVVALSDGRVGVAVGDVVGRGLEAAAVMGQLQSALRAFALQGEGPGAVVGRLARFAGEIPQASMATVVYGVLDLNSGELSYARAGQPPPLLVRRNGRATYLDEGRGPPLASIPGIQYPEDRATLEPGDTLLLYSDGLVERRRETIDAGLVRLARAAAPGAGATAEEVCNRVLDALFQDRPPADDVALLVLRRPAAEPALHRRVAARPTELSPLRRDLRRWLRAAGASEIEVQDVLVACGEALANAVEHAYRDTPAGEVDLKVSRGADGLLHAIISDFGRWRAPRPSSDRGRGLVLMEALMDAVEIIRDRAGTRVVLRRRIGAVA